MAVSAFPAFTASQDSTHVHLEIRAEGCPPTCVPRAVVDAGNVFGLACPHFHLPLIFPDNTLKDGTSIAGQDTLSSYVSLSKKSETIRVALQKQKEGEAVLGLEELKPSVFPLLEDDEEGRSEERLFGLEMLQRGREAIHSQGLPSSNSRKASTSTPRSPLVPKTAKTKVHEFYSDSTFDADEVASRKVAAYEAEEKHWDEGMYLDNFVDEDGEVKHLIQANIMARSEKDVFSQEGSPSTIHRDVHLLLLELLLAQAYDHRTMLGESTVESAWTISVLSRSLVVGCLPSSQAEDSASSVLVCSMRRQLSYPLYRSWKLSIQVGQDVVASLRAPCCRSLLSTVNHLFEREAEDEAMSIYSADVLAPLLDNYSKYFR